VLETFSVRKKWKNEICDSVKWLNRAKLEYLDDTLVIWIGQLNGKNGAATDGVVKEQMKVLGRQRSLCSKD
jgi:hypothetical protein